MSGSAIRNAMVDLRRNAPPKRARPRASDGAAKPCNAESTMCWPPREPPSALARAAANPGSGPHVAFDLALRPGERLLHRFALHEPHDHLGVHRLGIDLHGDL